MFIGVAQRQEGQKAFVIEPEILPQNLRRAVDETLPATVDVEQQVVDAAQLERIIAEVGTLSALDQQIFRLCAAEGYAYQAAAEQLGVSHGAVRNRLSRIRTQLRSTIEPEGT